jgi:glycerol uptake facilitator-like aquaporin
MFGRRKIATLVAEFLGTGVLTLLILSVQRSTIGVPFFVALAAGLTVALMVFALGGTSGAILNPALTLALWTARKISTLTGVLFIAAQMLGAWGAYWLYTYFVNSSLQKVGGHFTGRILVAEAVGTGLFAFGWAAALYQGYTRAVTASVAGLAYMLGIVAASSAAIGLLNPAVALGVRAWVWGTYVLGPVLGAIIGVNLFGLLFAEPAVAGASVAATSTSAAAARKPRAAKSAKRPATRRKK